MQVTLPVTTATDYFEKIGKEIDYDNEGIENSVTCEEADMIQKILTAEVCIFMLRRAYGICGSLVDDMVSTRRELITTYESSFSKKYIYNNSDEDIY